MLPLNDKKLWAKLDGPYDTSENIPALIQSLQKKESKEILDELCWDYIYHQGSLYQSTIATFPYLIELMENSDNEEYILDIFINCGIILMELQTENNTLNDIIKRNKLDDDLVNLIVPPFLEAVEQLGSFVGELEEVAKTQDEETKRFFLVTLAVIDKQYPIARIFTTFSQNDEYISICTHCKNEHFIWNEEGILNLYTEDPVSEPNQTAYQIKKQSTDIQLIEGSSNIKEWLAFNIEKYNIESLKTIQNQLFGTIKCPNCHIEYDVMDSIIESA